MRSRGRILTMLGLVPAVMALAAASAAAGPVSSTVLVDRPTGFGALPFDGVSGGSIGIHALSADGRYVAFTSSNDVLAPGDENSAENVYRLDRSSGTLAQVNVTAAGGQPSAGSFSHAASISADGRYVEFESESSNLIPGAPDDGFYVKDMQTGAVELASRATGLTGAAAPSPKLAVISGDGRHVAFTATGVLHADNADGVSGTTDAYVRALDAGTTHMVSVSATGGQVGGVNGHAAPDIDWGGDAVAFITDAKLDADDVDSTDDAYVRVGIGAQAEVTRFVSFTTNQARGADTAAEVALSGDGSTAAWSTSGASELDRSIFMSSLRPAVGTAKEVDVSRPDGSGSGGGNPVFNPEPRATGFPVLLYFRSNARLSGADTNDSADLYAAEIAHAGDGNFVHLESSGMANGPVDAGTGVDDGSVVAFASAASSLPGADGVRGEVYVRAAGGVVNVSQPSDSAPRTSPAGSSDVHGVHAVSDDGRTVIFETETPAFGSVPGVDGFRDQVVARDLVSGQTMLVSAAPDGSPANALALAPSLDATGRHAAFLSQATNLVGDANPHARLHAYVRDLATGAVRLVDRTAAGAPLADGVEEATISADGRHLAYTSTSDDAPGAPANNQTDHVYVVDLNTGATILADRSPDGTPGNKGAFHIDISDDGSRVAFESSATNLGAGASTSAQVYVRDLTTNTTTWASAPQDANPRHADPVDLSLSGDGTRVAFDQFSPDFGFGMTGSAQVFVRNLAAGTATLASRMPDGAVADNAELPSLSTDGSRVSFTTNFFQFPLISQLFVRDLGAGTTSLASVGRDAGHPARLGASNSSLSGNGACVAFTSASDDLVNPSYGTDFTHVFLRGLGAGCAVGFSDDRPGGGGGTGGDGTGAKPDRTSPRISGARLTHVRFAVVGSRTAIDSASRRNGRHGHAPHGTTFLFTVSENATTTIAIARHSAGRRSGARCVKPRPGLKRRCTRTVTLTIARNRTPRGQNSVTFSGRAGRTSLTPGRYVAQIVARDAAGNRSKPALLAFTVVAR